MRSETLTTTQAAALAGVGPSTVKRWADRGVLPVIRTAGGHRRYGRAALERFLRTHAGAGGDDPILDPWIRCLIGGARHEIDGALLAARARLGAWYRVADELGRVLEEIGARWHRGEVSVAQEHQASESLSRALSRICDALPTRTEGPTCLLACPGDEGHSLGLALAELCLRELGWRTRFMGQRTPVREIVETVNAAGASLVALSASQAFGDGPALAAAIEEVGAACADRSVDLIFGGRGPWPEAPRYGVGLPTFALLHQHLTDDSR